MSNYYVYRHIRNDINIPFYIGMGTCYKKSKYKRAFSINRKNIIWQRIVSKTDYTVEIIYESDNKQEIFNKEKEFIKIYGRIDKKTGSLANLTDGGDGSVDLNEDIKKIILEKNRLNGCFEKTGKKLVEWNKKNGNACKGIKREEDYFKNKKTFLYSNIDGCFIREFYNISEAALFLKSNHSSISLSIIKKRPYKDYIILDKYLGEKINTIKIKTNSIIVYKICAITQKVLQEYDSILDTSKKENKVKSGIHFMIYNKRICNNLIFSITKNINISEYTEMKYVSKRGTRKKNCSICNLEKENIKFTYCKKCTNIVAKNNYLKRKNNI